MAVDLLRHPDGREPFMATYDDLEDLIGPLKRARIDAWFVSQEMPWRIDSEENYYYEGSGRGMAQYCTRPDKFGEGGGKVWMDDWPDWGLGDQTDAYRAAFQEHRDTIDDHMRDFRSMVDPANIQPLIDHLSAGAHMLTTGAITRPSADGQTEITIPKKDTIGGAIDACVNLAGPLGSLRGSTAHAFRTKFINRIEDVVDAQQLVCVILGGHLEAQKLMWTNARRAIVDLVVDTTKAYDDYARTKSAGDFSVEFKIIGYALAGAGLFASGGLALVLGVGGIGLSVAADTTDVEEAMKFPGGTYSQIKDSFYEGIGKIRKDITSEETLIQQNLTTNTGIVQGHKGEFDLSRPALLDVNDGDDIGASDAHEILVNKRAVRSLTADHMPAVASFLRQAGTEIEAAWSVNLEGWYRTSLGISNYGPMHEWYDLWIIVRDLIADTADETSACAVTLDLAVQELENQDATERDALGRHAKRVVDVGTSRSEHNPWD
ncbi:hypothetical protein ACFQ0K_09300 [Nocardioides caeni]|uniref:Uncharacterized protein n=1 Tax=Nocardioides caeni TaxID=574700 RepID=A0A4S8N065_9ACTN|nr:hypothetical protein [Nocardioides caeni]THV09150.1 hypothetical protein E9934_17100 [Nocardioides caeni]